MFPSCIRNWQHLLGIFVICVAATSVKAGQPLAVGEALERPAVFSKQPSSEVLLGAARTGDRMVVVGERGIIAISDDDGAHWRQVSVPVSVTLTAVRFADTQHGYVVGHGGTVLVTSDGGETWQRRLDGRQAAQLVFDAAEASGDSSALAEAEWLKADGPDKPLLDLLVVDAQNVLVVGAYGLAFASTDGGRTWSSWKDRFDNPRGLHLNAIRRQGERIVVVGEQGLVQISEDSGDTFTPAKLPYEGSFFTVELRDQDEIIVAGLRGNLWRSHNAGLSWEQQQVAIPASITASAMRSDGSLVLVNQAGFILGERNSRLSPVNTVALPPLTSILPNPDGTLLALSVQGAISVATGDQK